MARVCHHSTMAHVQQRDRRRSQPANGARRSRVYFVTSTFVPCLEHGFARFATASFLANEHMRDTTRPVRCAVDVIDL